MTTFFVSGPVFTLYLSDWTITRRVICDDLWIGIIHYSLWSLLGRLHSCDSWCKLSCGVFALSSASFSSNKHDHHCNFTLTCMAMKSYLVKKKKKMYKHFPVRSLTCLLKARALYHKIIGPYENSGWRGLQEVLVEPPAQSRANCEVRPGCSGCAHLALEKLQVWRWQRLSGQHVPLTDCPHGE